MTQGEAQEILNPQVEQEVINAADLTQAPVNADLQTHPAEDTEMQDKGQSRTSQTAKGPVDVLGTSDVDIRGEQFVGEGGVLQSNNAVTGQARALVIDNPMEYTITGLTTRLGVERIDSETDLFDAVTAVSGSTKVKWGKNNPAQKSVVFNAPGGSGTRAGIITRDGTITMLANNTPYAHWYHKIKEQRGYGLIFRFDQSLEAKNPYMQCDVFKASALPAVSKASTLDWEEEQ